MLLRVGNTYSKKIFFFFNINVCDSTVNVNATQVVLNAKYTKTMAQTPVVFRPLEIKILQGIYFIGFNSIYIESDPRSLWLLYQTIIRRTGSMAVRDHVYTSRECPSRARSRKGQAGPGPLP